MSKRTILCCSFAVALIVSLVPGFGRGNAAPVTDGDLDPAFGSGGRATVGFPGGSDRASALVIQADGKLVMAGSGGVHFGLARYLPSGGLDPAFGQAGHTLTGFNGLSEQATALALQPDGKILAAGTVQLNPRGTQMGLAHYNPDGSLDGGFGSDGKVTDIFTDTQNSAQALAVQADGKIVVAGADGRDFALARLLGDGSRDPTFGAGGTVTTTIDPVSGDSVYALVIQPDGVIVAAGGQPAAANAQQFALARYTAAGSLDLTFGTGGIARSSFPGYAFAFALARQADGKLVAAGTTGDSLTGTSDFGLVRYLPDGRPDPSFGSTGAVTTSFSVGAVATALVIQTDGKLVAAGYTNPSGLPAGDFALARYRADGSLDSTFGAGGKVTTDFGGHDLAHALALTSGGMLVAAGDTYSYTQHTLEDFALARYTPAGQLDSSFGSGGKVITDLAGGNDQVKGLAIQGDGKLVLAGANQAIGGGDFALARLLPDGRLDSSFGSGGRVSTDFNGNGDEAHAVAIGPDGKIVVAGAFDVNLMLALCLGCSGLALARYNPDGSLDPTLGQGGKLASYFDNHGAAAQALALQPDGKILVAGQFTYPCGHFCTLSYAALVRYNRDGTFDSAFGSDGKIMLGQAGTGFNALALQPDGNVVAAGFVDTNTFGSDFLLMRFQPDGSLDSTFGMNGTVTTDFAGQRDDAHALVLQPDGKILAAGDTGAAGINNFALARYQTDGRLDSSFGTGGTLVTAFAGTLSTAWSLALQGDGKILAAGSAGDTFALARYNADGSPDPGFGSTGQLTTAFGPRATAYALGLQPDGKIVAAGKGYSESGGIDFAIVRYLNAAPPLPTPTIGPGCIFSDVCPSDYFFTPVQYLVQHGVLSGYADQTFRPYAWATRAQIAKILVLAQRWPLDTTGGPHFADVPPSHPFYAYVETAYHHGVISGYGDGTYRPYSNITRGQLSKVLVLAFGWPLDTTGGPHFTDVPRSQPFYASVETAYHQGILSGYADGTFRPANNAVRSQIAKLVYNALRAPSPTATPTATASPGPTAPATPPVETATATFVATTTGTNVPTSGTSTATPTVTPGLGIEGKRPGSAPGDLAR